MQADGDAVRGVLPRRELREDGHAEAGGDEGADGLQLAALARDARLESGGATRGECGVTSAAFVKYERLVREFREGDAALLRGGVAFRNEGDEGFGEEEMLVEAAARGRELDDAKFDASALHPLRDGFRNGIIRRAYIRRRTLNNLAIPCFSSTFFRLSSPAAVCPAALLAVECWLVG